MRSEKQIKEFKAGLSRSLAKLCDHDSPLSASRTGDASACMCECKKTWAFQGLAYEACVPKKFWRTTEQDIYHNKTVYQRVILNYQSNLRTAVEDGAGLFLHGPNGCGKTMFLNMLIMHCIKSTSLSCYYTTALQLDQDMKRTFGSSQASELRAERLRVLTRSHIFVLDELGKEKLKSGDSWTRRELELILRHREEENLPILLASNRNLDDIRKPVEDGGYGETVGSIIDGSCIVVPMQPGDQRKSKGKELAKKMGY